MGARSSSQPPPVRATATTTTIRQFSEEEVKACVDAGKVKGGGGSGFVYAGRLGSAGDVAVKVIPDVVALTSPVELVQCEIDTLGRVPLHPNVVRLLG